MIILWLLFALHLSGFPIPPAIAWIGLVLSWLNWGLK